MLAVQWLYACEASGADFEENLQGLMQAEKGEDGAWVFKGEEEAFAYELAKGTWSLKEVIDRRIQALSQNWDFERILRVDLAILRLGIYQLLYCPEIPAPVVLNESLELAKCFSKAQSTSFINGILDQVLTARSAEA